MFSFPLIFLAKLANEGLLHSDLTVIPANAPTLAPSPMLPTDKLCRLFLFGADLLESIAPSRTHPALQQAAFLRKVWEAAVSGRRSVTSAPSSPRPGTTTPSRFPQSILNPDPVISNGIDLPPQPPTFPPPALPVPNGAESSQPFDFSFSTSYQPTPQQSPRLGPINGSSIVTDPFSALLDGVSPNGLDGSDTFFSLDSGIDWSVLGGDGGGFGATNGGGPTSGFSFF